MAGNGQNIYSGLLARGFSPLQASVLAGNAQQESAFNPTAVNPTSGAYGLMQWLGPRATALQSYAQSTGRSPADPNAQLDFVTAEMNGPESGNVKGFLSATDVPTANAALKQYLRYGPNEGGKRLDYSMAFANPGAQGATMAKAPVPLAQPDTSKALDAIFGSGAAPTQAATPAPAAGPDTSSALDAIFGAEPAAPTPSSPPIATGTGTFAGNPVTPGALGNNPMARGKPSPASTAPTGYSPSAVPVLDAISAGANNLIDSIPFGIGPNLSKATNWADAQTNNLLGFPTETPADRAAINAAQIKQFPTEAAVGGTVGAVAPYLLAAPEGVAAKALGTASDYGFGAAGNLAARTAAGGLSSAASAGLDTAVRGGNPDDALHNALIAGGVGAIAAPAAAALGSIKGVVAKGAIGAGVGGAIGAGGTLAQGGSPQDVAQNALTGAGIGAAAGVGAGVVGKVANRLMQGGVDPATASLADAAINKYGIPLGAADISANPMVKVAKSVVDKMPFSGGTSSNAAQSAAFTSAVAKEMGTDAAALTPDVMAATRERIGNVFDSVATKVPNIPADQTFQNDVLQAMQDAEGSLGADKLKPFNNQVDNILKTFGGGNAITGQQFLSLTDKKSILSKAIANGGDLGNAASALKDALYGAMERAAPPDVLPALKQARYQWKVMRSVEDNAAKATDGVLSPPTLMQAVVKNFPNMAYDGAGNMGDLARIGQRFLKSPGSSQTSERGIVNNLLAGGGLAGIVTAPHVAIPALAGTLATSTAAGAAMRSRWLANSLIQGGAPYSAPMNMLTRSAVPALTAPVQNLLIAPAQ